MANSGVEFKSVRFTSVHVPSQIDAWLTEQMRGGYFVQVVGYTRMTDDCLQISIKRWIPRVPDAQPAAKEEERTID